MTNKFGQMVKVRRFYNQANDLDEKHPLFKPYYKQALDALGLTEEEGDKLIDACAFDPLEFVGNLSEDQKAQVAEALNA